MQKIAPSTFFSNAGFNAAYVDIWFNGIAPKPRVPFYPSSAQMDNQDHPSRLARILAPEKPSFPTSESDHHILPSRIERNVPSDAYVRTTTPLAYAPISHPTVIAPAFGTSSSFEIRSPRPSRNYNTAAFMLEAEYASQVSERKWEDYPPRNCLPSQSPQLSPLSSSDPAWPSSSVALSIPSFGILPSPVPERDPMAALLNYNSLTQPRPYVALNALRFDPFGDEDSSSTCSTSGRSPTSEWGPFNSPTASTTSLESNGAVDLTQNQDILNDAAQISNRILALDERKAEMDPEEYIVETAKIFFMWKDAYEKVKHVVDAGA